MNSADLLNGQRPNVTEGIDETTVSEVCWYATGRRVWRMNEVRLFQNRHVVANRGSGNPEIVAFDNCPRPHGFTGVNVVFDDHTEHVERALRNHGHLPYWHSLV